MAITAEEVQKYLEDLVKGADGMAHITEDDGVLGGYVVHRDFTGQAIPLRQDSIWTKLREKFGEDAGHIGMIFTYTPYEFEEIFGEESA
jgi:acid stress-induced BolA-like protein IbaG/YrbA